ncbi:hypothetical protein [Bradyrhizobium guangdongense]|uniref:XRE family transcriptional regulator n=1 Tax=Bradyrhizobium guangdongense TaxID=1325090 RepID=A0A410V741_9BRAD|nr:hypothetical protein [Bradyrhizobium guangdongense]QAU39440.1 hypothetical protein X265_18560 [Bradyrhizobium guangdongense]QOZ60499.1 hypothetical protein XH86_18565 [Bradyrhizobium guangdongense]GGI23781.1 hypothetical protein GCM10010987_26100 [Bradyrhizobium guangdongense]
MTGQLDLDLLEDLTEQSSVVVNVGSGSRKGRRRPRSVSLPFQRIARVAREQEEAPPAPDSPAAAASPPEACPDVLATPAGPFMRLARTKSELVAVLRARKEALNLSHEKIDQLVGWADRLSTKALAPVPKKGMSGDMLQAVLDALGLGVAAVVLVEDPEQSEQMRPRWTPRGPTGPRPDGALLDLRGEAMLQSTTEDHDGEQAPHQFPAER